MSDCSLTDVKSIWMKNEDLRVCLQGSKRHYPTLKRKLWMIRLVLFDIDGTLIRTGGAGVQAFAKVFETEFNAVDGFERLKFAGRTDVGLVREFFGFHAISPTPENFKRFFERYVFWLDQILQESEGWVCPGVWEFIDDLRALPEPPVLGLLTGNFRLGAEIKLRHFNLWEIFEVGAFADDHEERQGPELLIDPTADQHADEGRDQERKADLGEESGVRPAPAGSVTRGPDGA